MLMLDEQDLTELANVSKDMPKSDLSETQIEDMRRLLQSGISNKITAAVGIGVGAVAGLGLTTTGAIVGAAIGSVLCEGNLNEDGQCTYPMQLLQRIFDNLTYFLQMFVTFADAESLRPDFSPVKDFDQWWVEVNQRMATRYHS